MRSGVVAMVVIIKKGKAELMQGQEPGTDVGAHPSALVSTSSTGAVPCPAERVGCSTKSTLSELPYFEM